MSRTANNLLERHDEESAALSALIVQASDTSSVIRRRLADVAGELRRAADEDGAAKENLLKLANRFEQQAKAG